MALSRHELKRLAFTGNHFRPRVRLVRARILGRTADDACMANIGPRERRRRLISGVVMLALGIGIAAVLITTHVPVLWRLFTFLPFAGGAAGVFQWWDRT